MSRHSNVVVGLDIGTTKIAAIVGEVREHGLDVIGIGTHPSRGLKKGAVINVEATVGAIKKAVEEAELMAGGGNHFRLHRHRRRPHQGHEQPRNRGGEGQGNPRA